MLKIDCYTYLKSGQCHYDVRIGCIDIAHIWSPRKGIRNQYMVRLMFLQERGKVDFSKDQHFDTMEDCKTYISKEFSKVISLLNRLRINGHLIAKRMNEYKCD